MWLKLVVFIKSIAPDVIKKYVVSAILKLAGVSGGAWTWIVTNVLLKAWILFIDLIASLARLADQKNIDEKLNKKYQDQIKNGASENELIESETDILNGGRKP